MGGRFLVVSGPSGSGKSTLCRRAAARTGAHLSVSATTRPKSPGEVEGRDYYFMSEPEFLAQEQAGEFLESARVFDHYYGTPRRRVQEQLDRGRTVILEIDVQGALQVFGAFPQAEGILILPPDRAELIRRLRTRRRDSEQTIEKRLAKAEWEIEQAKNSGRYGHTICNDNLEEATAALVALIESQTPRDGAPGTQGESNR
ncbi:MAG: guanylate kinase [Sedimentisphaerales bacterium]|nr:guanylate kinase [Sedimentisphaerales bacterium]